LSPLPPSLSNVSVRFHGTNNTQKVENNKKREPQLHAHICTI
jgi:hypothetical protein